MRTLSLFLLTILPTAAAAQSTQPPAFVIQGLEAYVHQDRGAAVNIWTASWGEEFGAQREQLNASIRQLEQTLGKPTGYEVVRTVSVGQRIRRVYMLLWFESQPLFGFANTYEAPNAGWKLVDITWHTNPREVWPAALYEPE